MHILRHYVQYLSKCIDRQSIPSAINNSDTRWLESNRSLF